MAGFITYDANIIREFADRLYSQARTIIVLGIILGVIFGAVTAVGLAGAMRWRDDQWIFLGCGALAGAGIGLLIGQSLAFRLRLAAQIALCQVQIELNTRSAAETGQRSAMGQSR